MLYFDGERDDAMDISGKIEITTKHSKMSVGIQRVPSSSGDVDKLTCEMEIGGFEAKISGTPFDLLVNFFIDKFENKIKDKLPGTLLFGQQPR